METALVKQWQSIHSGLSGLLQLQTDWVQEHEALLLALLCQLESLAALSTFPVSWTRPSDGQQQGFAAILAGLLLKHTSFSLRGSNRVGPMPGLNALLLTTAHCIWGTCASKPHDADWSLPVADAINLAQQVSRTGLLQQLPTWLHDTAVNTSAAQQTAEGRLASTSTSCCLLHLAYAVCRIWPNGILKSATAGPLAAPTAEAAAALLQHLKSDELHLKQEPAVANAAIFSLHMVQQAHSRLCNQATAAPGYVVRLKQSGGFLLLATLVLHAQLQQYQQQQQQQSGSLASTVQQHVQQYDAAMTSLLGEQVSLLWRQQQCWQQHSTAADVCVTLQLLQQMLIYWERVMTAAAKHCSGMARKGMGNSTIVQAKAALLTQQAIKVADAILPLPVVLLQLASRILQDEPELCCAALETVAAVLAVQLHRPDHRTQNCSALQELHETLVLQWCSVVNRALGQHNGASNSRGTTAAKAAHMAAKLLQLLVADAVVSRHFNDKRSAAAGPVAAAVERCICTLSASPAAGHLFKPTLSKRAVCVVGTCIKHVVCYDEPAYLAQQLNNWLTAAQEGMLTKAATAVAVPAAAVALHQRLLGILFSTLKAYSSTAPLPQVSASDSKPEDAQIREDALSVVQRASVCLFKQFAESRSRGFAGDVLFLAMPFLALLGRVFRCRLLQMQQALDALKEPPCQHFSGSRIAAAGAPLVLISTALAVITAVAEALTNALDCLKHISSFISNADCNAESNAAAGTAMESFNARQPHACGSSNADIAVQLDGVAHCLESRRSLLSSAESALSFASKTLQDSQQRFGAPAAFRHPGPSNDRMAAEYTRCMSALKSAKEEVAMKAVLSSSDLLIELPGLLLAADELCALLPVSCCCNNPSCSNLSGPSELQLVGGKSCVCAGCKTARYCSRSCQKQHWRYHKFMCKQIMAAAAVTISGDSNTCISVTEQVATPRQQQQRHRAPDYLQQQQQAMAPSIRQLIFSGAAQMPEAQGQQMLSFLQRMIGMTDEELMMMSQQGRQQALILRQHVRLGNVRVE